MAKISIRRAHQLTQKQARDVADKVAAELAREFGIAASWNGDTADVKGTGVTGTLTLKPKAIELDIVLGFMLSVFEGKIRDGVEEKLDKLLGAAAKKSR